MTLKLHIGKLNTRVETSVTEAMDKWIAEKAHGMGIREADFVRELLYLGATNEIYSVHVAKDKAAAFARQPAVLPQESGK